MFRILLFGFCLLWTAGPATADEAADRATTLAEFYEFDAWLMPATGPRQGEESFADQWAWVELWNRRGDEWKLVGNASNRKALEPAAEGRK